MADVPKTHLECKVCGEWKHHDEMFSDSVCLKCSETHDKRGEPRP